MRRRILGEKEWVAPLSFAHTTEVLLFTSCAVDAYACTRTQTLLQCNERKLKI